MLSILSAIILDFRGARNTKMFSVFLFIYLFKDQIELKVEPRETTNIPVIRNKGDSELAH